MDDHQVKIVNATDDTILTVFVFPDGSATMLSAQSKEWVGETLRRLADTQSPADRRPMNADVPAVLIETVRTQMTAMVNEMRRDCATPPTEQIIQMFGTQALLSSDEHRQVLATTAAVLLQLAVGA